MIIKLVYTSCNAQDILFIININRNNLIFFVVGTVLAYGQTNSGKTYTMQGSERFRLSLIFLVCSGLLGLTM